MTEMTKNERKRCPARYHILTHPSPHKRTARYARRIHTRRNDHPNQSTTFGQVRGNTAGPARTIGVIVDLTRPVNQGHLTHVWCQKHAPLVYVGTVQGSGGRSGNGEQGLVVSDYGKDGPIKIPLELQDGPHHSGDLQLKNGVVLLVCLQYSRDKVDGTIPMANMSWAIPAAIMPIHRGNRFGGDSSSDSRALGVSILLNQTGGDRPQILSKIFLRFPCKFRIWKTDPLDLEFRALTPPSFSEDEFHLPGSLPFDHRRRGGLAGTSESVFDKGLEMQERDNWVDPAGGGQLEASGLSAYDFDNREWARIVVLDLMHTTDRDWMGWSSSKTKTRSPTLRELGECRES